MHISGQWLGNWTHCSGQPVTSLGPQAAGISASAQKQAGRHLLSLVCHLSQSPTASPVKAGSEGETRADHHWVFIAKLQRVIVKESSNPQPTPELRRK